MSGVHRKGTVSVADVMVDVNEVRMELLPILRADRAPPRQDLADWVDMLVNECRNRLSVVLPLTHRELEFLRRLNDEGQISPELLTTDLAMQATVRQHPGLRWKALNVRKHRWRSRTLGFLRPPHSSQSQKKSLLPSSGSGCAAGTRVLPLWRTSTISSMSATSSVQ